MSRLFTGTLKNKSFGRFVQVDATFVVHSVEAMPNRIRTEVAILKDGIVLNTFNRVFEQAGLDTSNLDHAARSIQALLKYFTVETTNSPKPFLCMKW